VKKEKEIESGEKEGWERNNKERKEIWRKEILEPSRRHGSYIYPVCLPN